MKFSFSSAVIGLGLFAIPTLIHRLHTRHLPDKALTEKGRLIEVFDTASNKKDTLLVLPLSSDRGFKREIGYLIRDGKMKVEKTNP